VLPAVLVKLDVVVDVAPDVFALRALATEPAMVYASV